MKIANPLNYPLAILFASISLFLGVRIVNLSSKIVIPTSILIAFLGTSVLAKDNRNIELENKLLAKELNIAKQEANQLALKAEDLRLEAKNLLHDSLQMDLLTTVEYTCDRVAELPNKIEALSSKISGGDSLLSIPELEAKLVNIQQKKKSARGIALQQLTEIEMGLQRNISLAQQGESARQAQVFSLTNLITDSAGILQQLQNKFRTADLTNSEELKNLQLLSEQLTTMIVNS